MRYLVPLFALAFIPFTAAGQPVDTRISAGDGLPVYIFALESESKEATTRAPERVEFFITYQNIAEVDVKAVQFGLLSVSPFGEVIAHSTWTDVRTVAPYDESEARPEVEIYAPSSLAHAHYYAFAYVNRVLLEDGREWRGNMDSVRSEIQETIGSQNFVFPDDTSRVTRAAEI